MLFLLWCALATLAGTGFDPSLLHVNLQIRPYADSKKYVGTKDGRVAVIRGRNLEMNCRIHEADGPDETYTIFVDGLKICHIEDVVRVCGSNSSEAQEWNIVPFPAEGGGSMGYMIRAQEDGRVHCMTRRDGEKNSLVMEPCTPRSGIQRWEFGFDSRTGASSGTLLGSLGRKDRARGAET